MTDALPTLAAITPLTDFNTWARTNLLEIVMLVSGTLVGSRLVSWGSRKVTAQIDSRYTSGDALVRSESAKHRHATVDVLTWAFLGLLYIVTGVLVVERLGVPLPSLVAPATVAGVAIGFGAQRVVQDILAGFLIVSERQYGFGDVVRISQLGATTGVQGTVEEVTLRITRLRTTNGEVVFVPNGQIVQATNLSRDWARAVIDVPVPATADVSTVTSLLKEVGEAAFIDEKLRPLLLDAPSVMGVESISVGELEVRLVARTLPGKQFQVSRVLRERIAIALRGADINVRLEADGDADEGPQE